MISTDISANISAGRIARGRRRHGQTHHRRRRITLSAVALGVAGTLAAACGTGGDGGDTDNGDGAGDSVEILLGHHHSPNGLTDYAANRFAEEVAELTDGEVTVEVIPSGQLGTQEEAADGVLSGTMDATIVPSAQMEPFVPEMSITTLPYVYEGWDHVDEYFNDGPLGQELEALTEEQGARILGWSPVGARHLFFRDAGISSLADMEGLMFRSPSPRMYIETFDAFGMGTTEITWSEAYSALQTGVADGLDSPLQAAMDESFEEVTNGVVLTEHMWGPMNIMISSTVFDTLSAEHQEALQEAGLTASRDGGQRAQEEDEQAIEALEEAGVTVHEFSAGDREEMESRTEPIVQEWAQTHGAEDLLAMVLDE